MKPGISAPSVYWPTIVCEVVDPEGRRGRTAQRDESVHLAARKVEGIPVAVGANHDPLEQIDPEGLAVVDPLMFSSWTFGDRSGLTVKLWKTPALSMSNPTTVPEFEIPFSLLPAAAFVPALGPSKLRNL